MSMTKKERAEFDRVVDELRLVAALRWTGPVSPDLPPPGRVGEGLTLGYMPLAESTDRPHVTEACSSSVSHGRDHKKTSSQNPKALYSSRVLALRALRNRVELHSAERLAYVDRLIAECEGPSA